MRTTKTRIAGAAGTAAFAGALLLGAAGPALAADNPTLDYEASQTCSGTTVVLEVGKYSPQGSATAGDSTIGLSATFTKDAPNTLVHWDESDSDIMIQSLFITGSGGSNDQVLATYSPVVWTSDFTISHMNEAEEVTVCYTVPATPTPTPTPTGGTGGEEGTPPPTSTVSNTGADNGAWKLALVGIGGLLATLAVVAPRRIGKKS